MNEKNDIKIIAYLLTKIHHYYPVGDPTLHKHYLGLNELKEIILKKMNQIQDNEKTPWRLLMSELRQQITAYKQHDFCFHQFASYTLNIELPGFKNEITEVRQNLVLSISLLVPYYTLFVVSTHKFHGYDDQKLLKGPLMKYIIHSKGIGISDFDNLLSILNGRVKEYFAKHEYLSHQLLFNNKVTSCFPYGLDINFSNNPTGFTYFDYLFSSDWALKDMTIL